MAELEKNPAKIPPGHIQVQTTTHIWHAGVYIGYRQEVGGPAVIHFQNMSVPVALGSVCAWCLRAVFKNTQPLHWGCDPLI